MSSWRPGIRDAREIILRRITPGPTKDEYGDPTLVWTDRALLAEVYPYDSPVERQALGIAEQETLKIILAPVPFDNDDVFLLHSPSGNKEMVFRVANAARYDPFQIVVANTGQTPEQYISGRVRMLRGDR